MIPPRLKTIQRVLGALAGLSALFFLPPLALALYFGERPAAIAFGECFFATAVLGVVLWYPARRVRYELRVRDGFFITTAAWVVSSAVTALPFILCAPSLSLADAVFESVSGLTTTGATTILGLDVLPRSMLFFRASLNFYGGMGIVILAVAILPMMKVGGMQLFRAESTGPVKDNKLTPRIAETAKALWNVYLGLNILCALAFWVAGMDFFDAVCHALATIATGGFSTHDAGFAHWDSGMVDAVATFFMLLGGVNFGLHFVAWRRASTAHYHGDTELRAFLLIVAAVSLLVALPLWLNGVFGSFWTSLRHAAFQTVSNITTTGFVTTGFVGWPGFVPLLLIMLGFVGGCSGSTAGGMKVARVVMVLAQGLREVRQLVHPKGQFLVKMGGHRVSESIVLSVSGFCSFYLLSFMVMTLAVTATGVDIVTAFSAVAACINNMGPGLGGVAVHFLDMNDIAVWICSFAMILGRLEVFTVLVLFTASFWRE